MAKIIDKIKEFREIFLFVVAILEVATVIIATYISTRLAPLSENISVIQTEIKAIDVELDQNTQQHKDFVSHEEIINSITPRLDRIEKNQDQLLLLIGKIK